MACVVWPTTLPVPEAPFDGEIGLPLRMGSPTDLGAFESSRVYTSPVISGSATLILTATEYPIFQTFYRESLNDGLVAFDAEWIFLLGYNGYRAKILDFSVDSLGAAVKVKLKMVLVPVAHINSGEGWFGDNDDDEDDYDEPEINGPSCSGYNAPLGNDGIIPLLQNGKSYAGSHLSNTSAEPGWDASSQHRIFGNYEVASSGIGYPVRPYLFGSQFFTYGHKASIAPQLIANGPTSSGFGINKMVDPVAMDPTSITRRTFIDNGCSEFEFVANMAINSFAVDAYIDLTLQILGVYGNILYEYVFPRYDGNLGSWSEISLSGPVPAGSRSVKYIIYFDRNNYAGGSTYAYINNMKTAFNLPSTGP